MSNGHKRIPGQFPARPLQVVMGGCSRIGPKERNDDAIAGRIPDNTYEMHVKGVVGCIADGISTGHNSDVAARTSVIQFAQDYYATPESWRIQGCAARLLTALNSWLYSQNATGMPESDGKVTTFTALILRSNTAHVIHIGDTRCMLLRDGEIQTLTEDHNASFMGTGETLTRALGAEPHVRADYIQERFQTGDVFLLTTDGVHGVLTPAQIKAVLNRPLETQAHLEDASRALCDAATEAGSEDNLSALILQVEDIPSETLTEAHQRLTTQTIPPVMKPGNRIDGYVVQEVLHSSTRSHAYRVRRTTDDAICVLKAPSKNFEDSIQYLEGFMLEQWVGRRIDNPQIMKIHDHEETRFLYYIAEWVQGETLRQWMDRSPRPSVADILPILSSLISATRTFHRLGMVHRDLKPENVILAPDGTVKIIDFGSVQVTGFSDLPTANDDVVPEGSLNYIAPEVLTGGAATNLSDLFSIAAMVYEMLAGQVPFALEERVELPSAPFDWSLRPLKSYRPDLPEATGAALARALSHDPGKRPEVMTEFLRSLQDSMNRRTSGDQWTPLIQRGSIDFWRGWAMVSTAAALIMLIALLLH
ncbi:protein kinase domain-containing protein [Granulosicoccus sp. 3-233]|uniref:protein kinase domain-containing protein n=1 Tax=Granulosicoccus sp. 3-233 TaxID=3417969 RepID=UPI003D34F613